MPPQSKPLSVKHFTKPSLNVGFVVGQDVNKNLMVLGGNQGDAVKVSPFQIERVAGFRWPNEYPIPTNSHLPTLNSDGKLSKNEA